MGGSSGAGAQADYASELLDGGRSVGHLEACGLLHELKGLLVMSLEGGEVAAGVDGLGAVARLGEVGSSGLKVAALHGGVGRVEVGNLVVGIHAHGGVEDLVELVGAYGASLGSEEELIEAQLLGSGAHKAAYLVDIGEGADIEVDGIVGVTQGRIYVGKQPSVLAGEVALDLCVARVGLERGVGCDGQDSVAVVDVVGLEPVDQAFPVFRLVGCLEEGCGEAVEIADVFLEGLGAAFGQAHVVGVGAFGRGESLDGDQAHGDILVAGHGVDRGAYLGQLAGVAAVVGIDLGAVDREVDESAALDLAALGGVGGGAQEAEAGLEGTRQLEACEVEVALALDIGAAAVVGAGQSEGAAVHPVLPGSGGGVFVSGRGLGCGPDLIGGGLGRSALIIEVALAAEDAQGGELDGGS